MIDWFPMLQLSTGCGPRLPTLRGRGTWSGMYEERNASTLLVMTVPHATQRARDPWVEANPVQMRIAPHARLHSAVNPVLEAGDGLTPGAAVRRHEYAKLGS